MYKNLDNSIVSLKNQSVSLRLSGLVFALIIGLNTIAVPVSGIVFMGTRLIQALELIVVGYLFHLNIHQLKLKYGGLNTSIIHIWWGLLFALTFFQAETTSFTIIYQWITIWMIITIFNLADNDDKIYLYKLIATILSILIYANTILFFIFPDGLWEDTNWVGTGDIKRYLFGNYNQTGMVCLLGIVARGICVLHTGEGYKKLYFLLIVSIITVAMMGSMTSTISLIIVMLYMLFRKLIGNRMLRLIVFSSIMIYVLFFFVFVWSGSEVGGVLSRFIEEVLNKDTTFSGRSFIWKEATDMVSEHFLFGYGSRDPEWMMDKIGGSGPHNLWILMLLEGGICLCSTFILLIVSLIFSILRHLGKESRIGLICLCAMLLMSLFETYNIICIFMLIIMVHNTLLLPSQE